MSSKIVAIIPARKGSKRLPGKNKKFLCGKPLIAWTIEEAMKLKSIDEIFITSNDSDIWDIAMKYFQQDRRIRLTNRPDRLCTDESDISETILYELLGWSDLTTVVLLQPTSPLRNSYDISMAIKIFNDHVSCPVIPVVREDEYHFKLNGGVFVFSLGALRLTKDILAGEFFCIYVMPKRRSVDIDTLEDFNKAEELMKKRLKHD
jgi:CMP-N-acetylneuraminic acid synthetase